MASISVFGLGYVGCVGIACLAKLGHRVVGCDVDESKVKRIAAGLPTIVERDVDEVMRDGFKAGLISATSSPMEAVSKTDISFLCVGTPNAPDGRLDTTYLMSAVKSIAEAIRSKSTFHIVVIRSTVPPGTNAAATALIEKISGKREGVNFAVASNPEFLREGMAVADYLNPPLTVIGCESRRALNSLRNLYTTLGSEIVEVEPKVAEIIKFVNNSYHALKVTFGNEIGAICKELDIDSHSVMNLFCMDTQLNISPYYFKPGFAYGGSCLPKDLRGLNFLAESNQVDVPVLSSIESSNNMHIQRVLERVQEIGVRSVGIIGLTFKAGTDDLRNSAAIRLAEGVLGKGCSLSIYDRYLNIALETETNMRELNRRIPHLLPLLAKNVEDVVESTSLVIITVRNPEIPELIRKYPEIHFLDLVRMKDQSVETFPNYEGFCW